MKTIRIKRMEMDHFRGFATKTVSFGAGVTNIGGANGTGKSTVRNAFLWCLFGKDAEGRTDYEIKHRGADGETLDKVDARVRVTLEVDGRETTLERSLREKWTKRRGQAEEVYTGNETVVSVDEVPLSVTQYKERVEGIIPESLFRLITTPEYFLGLPWRDQRAILFDLVGGVDDAEVASGNAEFVRLLEELNGKTLADYRKELATKKRKAREELSGIQPRIDQTEKLRAELTPATSREEAERRRGALEAELEALEAQVQAGKRATEDDKSDVLEDKRARISSLRAELEAREAERKKREDAVMAERRAQRDAIWERSESKGEEITAQKRVVEGLLDRHASLEREVKGLREALTATDRKLEEMREAYREASAGQWSGEELCPTCGRRLPEEQIEGARELYNRTKLERLEALAGEGLELKAERGRAEAQIADKEAERDAVGEELEAQGAVLERLERERSDIKAEYSAITLDYKEEESAEERSLKADIEGAEADLRATERDLVGALKTEGAKLEARRSELKAERDRMTAVTQAWKSAAVYDRNIAELEEEGRRLSNLIAEKERLEMVAAAYVKAKILAVEAKINSAFRVVRFRLYTYTIEGNEQETCIPLIDGVPYGAANTASQVNAGLDVIRTICEREGVTAPIFIDNRERVNEIPSMPGHQIINLRVTEGSELEVEAEAE